MDDPGDQSSRSEIVCLNCGHAASGQYCSSCGAEAIPPRLTFRSLLGVTIEHFLSLDLPMLRTAIDMLRFPGRVAAQFVAGRRKHYASPLKFNLIAAAIVMAVIHFMDLESPPVPTAVEDKVLSEAIAMFLHWNNTYLQVVYLFALPMLAVTMRLLFWKSGRNVMEHYALGLYTYGEIYLIQGVCILINSTVSWKWVAVTCEIVSSSAPFVYYAWAATQFIRARATNTGMNAVFATIWAFVRALLAAVIFVFAISAILIGAAAIVVIRKNAMLGP